MTDSIDNHIRATPEQCELVMRIIRVHRGGTFSNIAAWSGISRALTLDALEQMESRGAVRHDGPQWSAVPQ